MFAGRPSRLRGSSANSTPKNHGLDYGLDHVRPREISLSRSCLASTTSDRTVSDDHRSARLRCRWYLGLVRGRLGSRWRPLCLAGAFLLALLAAPRRCGVPEEYPELFDSLLRSLRSQVEHRCPSVSCDSLEVPAQLWAELRPARSHSDAGGTPEESRQTRLARDVLTVRRCCTTSNSLRKQAVCQTNRIRTCHAALLYDQQRRHGMCLPVCPFPSSPTSRLCADHLLALLAYGPHKTRWERRGRDIPMRFVWHTACSTSRARRVCRLSSGVPG